MNKRMQPIVAALLMLAAAWTAPAAANNVVVFDDVYSHNIDPGWWFAVDSYEAQCTQPADYMCVSLESLTPNGDIHLTAVVASPTSMLGQAWGHLVFYDQTEAHCFAAPSPANIKAYITASNEQGFEQYRLQVQCLSGGRGLSFVTRGTAVTIKQDQ